MGAYLTVDTLTLINNLLIMTCYIWTIRSAYKVPLMKTQRVLALLKSRG